MYCTGTRGTVDAAADPKQLYVIPGSGHNDTYVVGGEAYFATLATFVDGLAR